MDDLAGYAIPTYVSHKRVKALEILVADRLSCRVSFIEIGFPSITLPAEMWSRYQPQQGDYLLIYEDGYKAFSPRKAFLEGYKPSDNRSFTDIKKDISLGKAHPDKA